jgi:hypothetical protein
VNDVRLTQSIQDGFSRGLRADQEVRRRIERSNSLNLTLSARQVCQIGIGLAVKGGISNGQQTLTSR